MVTTVVVETVVIDDGQYRWAADRAQLLAALAAGNWTEVAPGRWEEPEADRDTLHDDIFDAADEPYDRLCSEVDSLAGEGATAPMTDEIQERSESFRLRADYGPGTWLWT